MTGGCSEFSSIFLALADVDDLLPNVPASFEMGFLVCKGLFALSFSYFRVVGWWINSASLWSDTLDTMKRGTAEKLRPGMSSFLYSFLALNLSLGALQLYWFGLILQKVAEM
jgi:hypothetical protein